MGRRGGPRQDRAVVGGRWAPMPANSGPTPMSGVCGGRWVGSYGILWYGRYSRVRWVVPGAVEKAVHRGWIFRPGPAQDTGVGEPSVASGAPGNARL